MLNPFSNTVTVKMEPIENEENMIQKWEEEEDLGKFDFKVPAIAKRNPSSLESHYSPFGNHKQEFSSFQVGGPSSDDTLSDRETKTPPREDESAVNVKVEEEDTKMVEKTSLERSSSESKAQTSDSSEPPRKRKRASRKRKATPQSRRMRQENNKRAAARYRQRRKKMVMDLEEKVQSLSNALERKNDEVEHLKNKTSVLQKQVDYFKKLLGKTPALRLQAGLQMVVCVFAIILGVAVASGPEYGTVMSHHRKVLSVDPIVDTSTCLSWGAPSSWSSFTWSSFAWKPECYDATSVVSMLRVFFHIVVVPLILW
eukprot:CAMPEP_0167753838 /NCGR_PEP_ID=MMETSP0110_2-20121227/7937_1 /TAXON_ID=629695 /ORGANISM="Gymnochlora sp., Strain CCMP2014" /LENGTH=312 /DNA_ID=CAMNT_0007639651 /DNA_START=121 /DNA_END=1056 /DNA_ORIENTATION=-